MRVALSSDAILAVAQTLINHHRTHAPVVAQHPMSLPIRNVGLTMRGVGTHRIVSLAASSPLPSTCGRKDIALANRLLTVEARRADHTAAANAIASLANLEFLKRIEQVNAMCFDEIAAIDNAHKKAKREAREMYPEAAAAAHTTKRMKHVTFPWLPPNPPVRPPGKYRAPPRKKRNREEEVQMPMPMSGEGEEGPSDCPHAQ
tara:strand:+ start:6469 stop:7077 length:609 start_codon:yes stop_codon:yes gene_type:complete